MITDAEPQRALDINGMIADDQARSSMRWEMPAETAHDLNKLPDFDDMLAELNPSNLSLSASEVYNSTVEVDQQVEYPPLNGCLADGAGALDFSQSQASCDVIEQAGANPFVLTFDNSQGVSSDEYESGFIDTVILPSLEGDDKTKYVLTVIDYQNREVQIYYGAQLGGILGSKIDQMIDANIGLLGQDANAFIAAISQDIAEELRNAPDLAATEAAAAWTPTPVPPSPTPSPTSTPRPPSETELAVRKYGPSAAAGMLGLAGLGVAAAAYIPLERRRRITKKARDAAFARYDELDKRMTMGGGTANFDHLEQMYKSQGIDGADSINQQRQLVFAQVKDLQDRYAQLQKLRLSVLRGSTNLREYEAMFEDFKEDHQMVFDRLDQIKEEVSKLQTREAEGPALTQTARTEFDAKEDWYAEQKNAFPILPSVEVALVGVKGKLDEAEQLVRGGQLNIKAGDAAKIVLKSLKNFQTSIEAMTNAYTVGANLQMDIQRTLQKWVGEVLPVDQLFGSGTRMLTQAQGRLSQIDNMLEATKFSAAAEAEFKRAGEFSNAFAEAMRQRDENYAKLAAIFGKGYLNRVQQIQGEVADDVSGANQQAAAGAWAESSTYTKEIISDSKRALQVMEALVVLHDKNETEIAKLSIDVGQTESRRIRDIGPMWNTFQADFAQGNYEIVENNYTQAGAILADLFDQPGDETDMASHATKLNSMEVQDFKGSEKLIGDMRAKLANAEKLMEALVARYNLAVEAKRTHRGALDNAHTRIEDAIKVRDARDVYVDPTVDQKIVLAEKKLAEGEEAATDRLYIKALELATESSRLAIEAKDSAENQIENITQLFARMDTARRSAQSAIERANAKITSEVNTIVASSTRQALQTAISAFSRAQAIETGLGSFEDKKLAENLQAVVRTYESVESQANQAMESLRADQERHKSKLARASSAIRQAESAIRSAESKVGDTRASGRGSGSLSRARSMKPADPSYGDTDSEIESIISQARSAESAAESAENEAEREIQEYEEEQRRRREEEARQRRLEEERREAERERERERERARQRAEDQARQARESAERSRQASTNHNFGGGKSSNHKF